MKELQQMKSAEKMVAIRKSLRNLSVKLDVSASMNCREAYTINHLLREAYGLKSGAKLHTFEGWKKRGAAVKRGEHALLFWGKPVEREGSPFYPVVFLFSANQVHFTKKGGAQ